MNKLKVFGVLAAFLGFVVLCVLVYKFGLFVGKADKELDAQDDIVATTSVENDVPVNEEDKKPVEDKTEEQKPVVKVGRNDCQLMGLNGDVKSVHVCIGHDDYIDDEFNAPADLFTASFDRTGKVVSAKSPGCSLKIERGVREGYEFVQFNVTEIKHNHTVYVQFGCEVSVARPDYFSVTSSSEGMSDVNTYVYDSKGMVTGIERDFYDVGMRYSDLYKGDSMEDRFLILKYKLVSCSNDNFGNWVKREYKNSRGGYLCESRDIEYYE